MDLHQSLNILDRLLIEQRGKRLEPLEREILVIAWENESYQKIESYQEQTVKNRAVKLWRYLSELLRTKVNKHNLRQILAGLKIDHISPETLTENIDLNRRSKFYGRLTELWQLQQWIESEQSKPIFLYGMKGIGKTTLIRKLTEQLAPKLDHIVWISLEAAPPLIEILPIIIKVLGDGRNAKLSKNIQTAINKTISYLQSSRCLLVFDNADPIFSQDERLNHSLAPDYVQFFDQLNALADNIYCLTITTEKYLQIQPSDLQLELSRLDQQSCQDLIYTSELIGDSAAWDSLVDQYQGNPQYLKIVANTISDIFAGKIEKFLATNVLVYQQIETLLSQQLDLLSNAEMSILIWLAIECEPIDLDRLQLIASISISNARTVKILDKLVRKYLIEVRADRFTLPNLIMEYVTDRYQDLVSRGMTAKKLDGLHLHPIRLPNFTPDIHVDIEKLAHHSKGHNIH
jgi:D-ribose pyranose/furanose isomerase RbsD